VHVVKQRLNALWDEALTLEINHVVCIDVRFHVIPNFKAFDLYVSQHQRNIGFYELNIKTESELQHAAASRLHFANIFAVIRHKLSRKKERRLPSH